MALTSLRYDPCAYQHRVNESIGGGEYAHGTPLQHCLRCLPDSPYTRVAAWVGPGQQGEAVDVDSDLRGITRRASDCPAEHYLPGQQSPTSLTPPDSCAALTPEDTRLSNPPCTLRGTGWNRWQWLCRNPQDNVLPRFDHMINSRILFKDNHRPCLPVPLDQRGTLPRPRPPVSCTLAGHGTVRTPGTTIYGDDVDLLAPLNVVRPCHEVQTLTTGCLDYSNPKP
jgi:hypothetical protein